MAKITVKKNVNAVNNIVNRAIQGLPPELKPKKPALPPLPAPMSKVSDPAFIKSGPIQAERFAIPGQKQSSFLPLPAIPKATEVPVSRQQYFQQQETKPRTAANFLLQDLGIISAPEEPFAKLPFKQKAKFFGESLLDMVKAAPKKGAEEFGLTGKKTPLPIRAFGELIVKVPIKWAFSMAKIPESLRSGKAEGQEFKLPDAIPTMTGQEVTTYFRDVEKNIQAGVNPIAATALSGFEAILDTAIVGGWAQSLTRAGSQQLAKHIPARSGGMPIDEARSVLNVNPKSTLDDIKIQYRKLAHIHHPDMAGGSEKVMSKINEAYHVLAKTPSNPKIVRVKEVLDFFNEDFGKIFSGKTPQTPFIRALIQEKLNPKVAVSVIDDAQKQLAGSAGGAGVGRPDLAKALDSLKSNIVNNQISVNSWGDLFSRMTDSVKHNPKALDTLKNHLQTRWNYYISDPETMTKILGPEFVPAGQKVIPKPSVAPAIPKAPTNSIAIPGRPPVPKVLPQSAGAIPLGPATSPVGPVPAPGVESPKPAIPETVKPPIPAEETPKLNPIAQKAIKQAQQKPAIPPKTAPVESKTPDIEVFTKELPKAKITPISEVRQKLESTGSATVAQTPDARLVIKDEGDFIKVAIGPGEGKFVSTDTKLPSQSFGSIDEALDFVTKLTRSVSIKPVPKTPGSSEKFVSEHTPIRQVDDKTFKTPLEKQLYNGRVAEGIYDGQPVVTNTFILEFQNISSTKLGSKSNVIEAPTQGSIASIINNANKNLNRLSSVIGLSKENSSGFVMQSGKKYTFIDSQYYNYFSRKYKGAEFYQKANDSDSPIIVKQGDKIVGVVAPLSHEGGTVIKFSDSTNIVRANKPAIPQKEKVKKAVEAVRAGRKAVMIEKSEDTIEKFIKPRVEGALDEAKEKIPRGSASGEIQASKQGKRVSINELIAKQSKTTNDLPETFKVSDRAKKIMESFGVASGEKSLPKFLGGYYRPAADKIRVQANYDIVTVAHETAHAIDRKSGLINRFISNTTHGHPLRRELTDLYEEFYPEGKRTHKLETRMREGFATLIQFYFTDPASIAKQYPNVVREFINPEGKFYEPDTTKLLDQMNELVDDFAKLPPDERIGARIRRGEEIIKKDTGFNWKQRLIYEGLNRFEPLARYAKQGKAEYSLADPLTHAFVWQARPTIIRNWFDGNGAVIVKPDGNFELREGVSISKYLELVGKKDKDLDTFLVARRVVTNFEKLSRLKEEIQWFLDLPKNEKKAAWLSNDNDIRETLPAYQKLKKVIVNDDFSLQDATATVNQFQKTNISEAAKIYDSVNESLLDFSFNTGLLNKKAYETYKNESGYASFQRYIDDEIAAKRVGTIGTNKSKIRSFKARTGSNLDIVSPIYNQMIAVQEVITKGLENTVWQKIANLSTKNKELAQRFEKMETQRVFDKKTGAIFYPQEKDPTIIRVFQDGKRRFYKAAPEFQAVARQLTPAMHEQWAYLIRLPSSIFTRLTTSANPFWAMGNITVDQISAAAQTKTNLKPFIDPFKNLLPVIKNELSKIGLSSLDKEIQKYFVIGGLRQTISAFYDLAPEDIAAEFTKQKTVPQQIRNAIDSGIGFFELPSNMSEVVTRFSEFQRAKKLGDSDIVAYYKAQQVTIPFQQYGNFLGFGGQQILKSLPYFNAGLQVLYKAASTGKEQPFRQATVAATVFILGVISAIASMRAATEKQKRILAQTPSNLLARRIYIPLPNGDEFTSIRVPELFGAPMALTQMFVIANYTDSKVTFDEFLDTMTSWLPQQLNLAQPRKAIFSWLPQTIKPSIEVISNTKTFPNIARIEPDYFKNLPVEKRAFPSTSPLALLLGKIMGVSPVKTDFFLREQFGSLIGTIGGFSAAKIKSDYLKSKFGIYGETYFGFGRLFNHFYNQKAFIDKQYEQVRDKDSSFSIEERAQIRADVNFYSNVSELFSELRKYEKSNEKIPENVQEAVFEILVALENNEMDQARESYVGIINDIVKIKQKNALK